MQGGTRGTVAACLSSVPHVALLPHALRPFRERFPEVHLDLIDGVFPTIESSLRDGALDFYIGPVPGRLPGAGLLVEKLFDNTRVIVARKGHPLARARSLGELTDAEWITTSITHKADEELSPLFAEHGLPAPRLALQSHSALTFVVALVYSDLLMMLPVQWLTSPLTRGVVQPLRVTEPLPAPPVCVARRAGLPLTPAAEYFCDMVRRAAGHMKPLRARS